jgi:uncharacterized membrane protein/nitrite reductase/ring-hydroxylating ferredoxin subunit
MKSKAVVMGHPLHPMLIPFPFAFLTGAVLFDAAGAWLENPSLWTTGGWLGLAGIFTGILAAVPGIVDYLYVVPPASSGKRRATKHALANAGALLLFGAAAVIRGGPSIAPGLAGLILEIAGLALLSAGGWMGGTLVYRNQIAVDHRYAHAGKWQESTFDGSPRGAITVARSDDLQVGQMRLLHVGGRRIALGRTERGYAAFADRCTHRGASLADGVLICGVVQCPWHGSQFDVATGAVKAGPARKAIETHALTEEKDTITLKP